MDNIGILKTTYYMNNGIYLTDIRKELVSKSLTFGCALYETCNIYELDHSRCDLLGVVKIR